MNLRTCNPFSSILVNQSFWLIENFAAIEQQMADPDIFNDPKNYEKISREYQRLSSLLSKIDELEKIPIRISRQ